MAFLDILIISSFPMLLLLEMAPPLEIPHSKEVTYDLGHGNYLQGWG